MAESSAIEWCDATWNPWWGCAEVSPGCSHCYAGTLARRYGYGSTWPEKGEGGYERAHDFRFFGDAHWDEPLKWARLLPAKLGRRPRVFCASMADVFEERPELVEPRARLFELILRTPELDWLILTKRPEYARVWLTVFYEGLGRLAGFDRCAPFSWVWMGTSIENARYTYRADLLRETPAAVRFLSCEPLLGSLYVSGGDPVEVHPSDPRAGSQSELNGPGGSPTSPPERVSLQGPISGESPDAEDAPRQPDEGSIPSGSTRKPLDLTGIDWVIAGGESGGRKSRPMHPEWAREIRDACLHEPECAPPPGELCDCDRSRPAFFFKQWGSWGPSSRASSQPLYVARDGVKTDDPWNDPGFAAERVNPGERWKSLARMSYLGVAPKSGGNLLDGREWKEFPPSKVETREPERSAA